MPGMTGLEGHPFFAGRGHHHGPPHAHGPGGRGGRGGRGHHHGPPGYWGMGHHGRPHHWGPQNDDSADAPEASRSADQTSEPTPGPSTEAENRPSEKAASASEPEADNDNRCHGHCGKGKFGKHGNGHGARRHGLGKKEFGKRDVGSASESESDGDKHGHGRCGKGRHGMGRGGRGGRGRHGPGHHGPPGAGPFGPYGHGRGPHGWGRHGRGRHHGPPGGNFGFLRQLAAQFGIPFDSPQKDVDFVPTVDVFDTPANYIMHVSLPGANKNDLSIDYDADESVLRLAGVVYRPGMSEELHQSLAMEERSREVGVFEREVRLGTREAPAPVSVDEITAKLEDGVLTVTVPKIEPVVEPKKKVIVEDGDAENEKDAMHVDEASVALTPEGSDEEEEDTREYVKIPVQ
jgi:HSP20 family protein